MVTAMLDRLKDEWSYTDPNDRERLVEAIRTLNDLADVNRAISVAAKLVGEKLEEVETELIGMLSLLALRE
jgi:hypothetical protein